MRRLGAERRNAGKHVVEGDSHRIEITAMIDRMPLRLLGAHVQRRSHRHARLRQVETPGPS